MEGEIMTPESNFVLITGATGFLGTQIIQRLLNETQHELIVLVRGNNEESALHHLKRAWWEFPELNNAIGKRIHLLTGDITQKKLDLPNEDYQGLVKSLTHIIHTAADLRLNAPLEELRKTNMEGTINMLELAREVHEDHGLERFSHVSTAYVAGKRKGMIYEDSLTDEAGFLSNYEKSKYESELEVKNSDLPVSIFRPGMIVGDSKTGYIKTFNTLYTPLRLYLTEKQRFIPMDPTAKINLIPVDYVADAITHLTFKSDAEGLTFHLTSPNENLPTVEGLIKRVKCWSRRNLGLKLPRPRFTPRLAKLVNRLNSSSLIKNPQTKRKLETINILSPYFNEERQFSIKNTEKFMGKFQMNWQDYLPKLLEFAVYMGFFHRSERTVHEQILFRLKRRNRPVKYYDIVEGEFKSYLTEDIRQDMFKAANSLQKMGIKKGDRVALVGFNSTRYLILDVAIGLVGAVSVPLYYTSSLEEIKDIIKDSATSIIFVGVPGLMEKLKEEECPVNLISFYHGSATYSSIHTSKVNSNTHDSDIMSWDDFLNLADNSENQSFAPVDMDDMATIRYTSGTTGKPRGVMFSHGKLRWMAEYIASMPPWENRNEEVSYLSFLPMNHVVEGIMGLYAPYYAPAPINIYFLENFKDLPTALKKVRPNIFFSVPRFYEKVWSSFSESRIGKFYLNRQPGLIKDTLKKISRRGILKKAGLDRCAQLIVGSAPVSDDLIWSYHDLGIEIYNAYGLTEAPLLTINRLKTNRIGTVGEPLPHTKIKIGSDGEVKVKGPQVMDGYYNIDSDSYFDDGWLFTGDFGHLTPEGSLIITGRKKEMLVNSYGKTISPLKTESMLRDIPCVLEAMVVGDGKPYCTCLLWFDEEPVEIDRVNTAIKVINARVSKPEEIKKWVALRNDLSIENGDLTANLKLKRGNIIDHYQDVIRYIYDDGIFPDIILHLQDMDDPNEKI